MTVQRFALSAIVAACFAVPAFAQPPKVDFGRDVLPIFRQNCVACHGPSQATSGLRLDRKSSVFKDGFRRVVPRSSPNSFLYHRLTGTDPVSLSAVTELPVILLEEGHCLRDQALSVCRLVGTQAAEMQATGMPTLCQMVATGLGVTLLPESAVALEARPGTGLTTRPFADPVPTRTIGLVWRLTSPNDGLYRELSRLLSDHLAGRPGGEHGGAPPASSA